MNGLRYIWLAFLVGILVLCGSASAWAESKAITIREKAELTYAPEVPPAIARSEPAIVEVYLDSGVKLMKLGFGVKYEFWTFNDHVPGPFIRVRVGDTLEVHATNSDNRIDSLIVDVETVLSVKGTDKSDKAAMRGKVVLSSMHKSKGLEADTVFILDTQIMYKMCGPEGTESHTQEKNLEYVAITRAKNRLVFIDSIGFKD